MNRSLYSGVSGLKAHQTRMDVIGNNIANVNTYGFKSSRVTFSDVYYQTVSSGSAGSSTSGGTNSGGIGYGTSVGSIDMIMGQSSFTMTDSTLDLAIDGEGFLQVQDADGNKFFTRAGALSFDSAGNLVDSQGNFVLGINGNPLGQNSEGNSLIQINLPSVAASTSSAEETINNIVYTLKTSNASEQGNISMQIISGYGMTDGELAVAEVGTNGIVVTLNANESFDSLDDVNNAINNAIETYMQANVGSSHPAGKFTLSANPSISEGWPRTGEQICSTDFTMTNGKIDNWPTNSVANGFRPTGTTGADFLKGADPTKDILMKSFTVESDTEGNLIVKMTIDNEGTEFTYEGKIDPTKTETGTMKLTAGGADYIVVDRPSYNNVVTWLETAAAGSIKNDDGTYNALAASDAFGDVPGGLNLDLDDADSANKMAVTPAEETKSLGLSGSKLVMGGGTVGGAQGIESLTGVAIGADGVVVGTHAQLGEIVIGQICLVTFANPEGLVQSSGTYFTKGPNSGEMISCVPGQDGAGQLVSGSLELSNVDLSKEFSDMITTQRGYQACSRLITVSDTMLEELVNLKR